MRKKNAELKEIMKEMKCNIPNLERENDALEEYGRQDTLEIRGIRCLNGENTEEVVIDIEKYRC